MSYRARRAVPSDAPELVRFLAAAGGGTDAACRHALAHEAARRCWVVECGHAIVGTMCVVARAGLTKPYWLIESIDVDAAHRGQGLTRLLLAAVRADARLHKVRRLATLCAPRWHGDGECLLRGRLY